MNEEKIAVYERRTSVTIAASGVSRPPDEEAGSEQDLKAEVAKLRNFGEFILPLSSVVIDFYGIMKSCTQGR